ncbi:MAG: metallophosphoesterase family protein [Caulobacterales bacterium]|nr:metallophosphoesterase family protein [Caulobacterales bacterium]
MAEAVRTTPFLGRTFAVLADCHIHPGGGPQFPQIVLNALQGVDLIVTLGDMGDVAGLDQLDAIAPVVGVRGEDDEDDPRTSAPLLVLTVGDLAVGCVFDAVAAGLAETVEPFEAVADAPEAARRVFGREVDLLLHAATHRPGGGAFGPRAQALNPGSAVLPAGGAGPTFARITLDGGAFVPEIVLLG